MAYKRKLKVSRGWWTNIRAAYEDCLLVTVDGQDFLMTEDDIKLACTLVNAYQKVDEKMKGTL